MARLLILPSGCALDPTTVAGIVKFANKGVVFRNEYNKIIVFEAEPDAARQSVLTTVVAAIVNGARDWVQPDWAAEFAKLGKPTAEVKPGNPGTSGNSGQNKAA